MYNSYKEAFLSHYAVMTAEKELLTKKLDNSRRQAKFPHQTDDRQTENFD